MCFPLLISPHHITSSRLISPSPHFTSPCLALPAHSFPSGG
ncbi:hypothetical protein E2C01_093043 [Portunus trituberculatus]|uniref:Uncharacterized protein n=1 Tax=Portunus trituberculatus TaxID=210409 RepID=A0A5B7JTU7_PORTR|nr:hypothetical protein [Portunus trituberculatus]